MAPVEIFVVSVVTFRGGGSVKGAVCQPGILSAVAALFFFLFPLGRVLPVLP